MAKVVGRPLTTQTAEVVYHPMSEALNAVIACHTDCEARKGDQQVQKCWERLNAGTCPRSKEA